MLSISPKDLKTNLARVKPAVNTRSAAQVLGGVRIVARDGFASFEATDMYASVCRYVTGESVEYPTDGGFDAIVPLADLERVLKVNAKRPAIVFTHDANEGVVKAAAGSRTVTLHTLPLDEWPKLTFEAGDVIVEAPAPAMHDEITRALAFASRDDTRPHLTTVSIDRSDAGTRYVATDSYRLGIIQATAHDTPADVKDQTNVLSEPLAKAVKNMKGAEWVLIRKAANDDHHAIVAIDDEEFWNLRLMDGNFPNWRQLLPDTDTFVAEVTVPRSDFIEACQAASVFATRNAPMRLVLNGSVRVEARGVPGEGGELVEELVNANYVRKDSSDTNEEYGYNPEFMLDCAKMIGHDETLTLRMISPLRPALLSAWTKDKATPDSALLMPIRLNV